MHDSTLLASLEAQGKEFLTLFADLETKKERVKDHNSLHPTPGFSSSTGIFDDEPEEWTGFASDIDLAMDTTEAAQTALDGARVYCYIFAARTN